MVFIRRLKIELLKKLSSGGPGVTPTCFCRKMGCDGGSIPKRREMVKTRSVTNGNEHKDLEKWNHCFLSGEALSNPIVGCGLGRLYNKEAVIKYLLDRDAFPESQEMMSHITSLKDLINLKLTSSSSHSSSKPVNQQTSYKDAEAMFVCPVTGREMNGKFRFIFYRGCGCVLSEEALKELKAGDAKCIACGKDAGKAVPIYGSEQAVEALRQSLARNKKTVLSSKTPSMVKRKLDEDSQPSTKGKLLLSELTGEVVALKKTKNTQMLYKSSIN